MNFLEKTAAAYLSYKEKQAEEHGTKDTYKDVIKHGLIMMPVGAAMGFGIGKGLSALSKTTSGNKLLSNVFHDPNALAKHAPGVGLLFGAEHGFGFGSEIGTAEAAKKGHIIKQAAIDSLCEHGLKYDYAVKLVKEAGFFDSIGSAFKGATNFIKGGTRSMPITPGPIATAGIRG